MEVRWSIPAADDLEHIFNKLANDNPRAARKVAQAIYDGCAALKDFPQRGRPSSIKGRRELVFSSLPYIAVYQIREHAVEISRIYHGAQDWT